jgi:ABC-type branched-subunit amino acid transport system ATPase component
MADRPIETGRAERDMSLYVSWEQYAAYEIDTSSEPFSAAVSLGGVSEIQATLGFLISVLPLALPLLDLEPLHGAAVEDETGRVYLILGDSGVGKSTIANELRRRGWRVLTDDACAVDAMGRVSPGPPVLAVRVGEDSNDRMRYVDKEVSLLTDMPTAPMLVAGVFVLERGEQRSGQLDQGSAFSTILRYVRAPSMFRERRRSLQLAVCAEMAGRPTVLMNFEADDGGAARLADEIEGWAS